MNRFSLYFMVLLLPLMGCRAAQVASDHNRIRSELLDLYTEQVMDNLVRAHNGLPIVQIDYNNIVGQVQTQGNAMLGGSQTGATTTSFAAGAMAAGLTRVFTKVLSFSGSATNSNTLSMTGTPLINNNDVYTAYLQFLEDPQNLVVTTEEPPEGAAHLCREYCGCYYWIPCDRRGEFFKLYLATTVMRGQSLKAPKDFVVTVDSLVASQLVDEEEGTYQVLFSLRGKIPNAPGQLKGVINGVELKRSTREIEQEDLDNLNVNDRKAPEYGKDTQLLLFIYSTKKIPFKPEELAEGLAGGNVTIRIDGFAPPVPTVESILDKISNDQSLMRMQQTILPPPR